MTNGPAESIDDSNDGIQRIEQTPLIRNNVAAETDRRNEEAELHDKRNYITEIPEFNVESRQKQARTERGEKGHQRKQGKGEQSPIRQEVKPYHQDSQQRGGDQEIRQTGNDGAGRNDQTRKIDLRY